MKINWGTGIVIAIIGFITFIMYYVVTMTTSKSFDHDLVTDKYYQKELSYQQEINALKNAADLKENISIRKTEKGLFINFPEDFDINKIRGKVFLYRPSNKQLDFELPISLSNNYLLVPENRLLGGRWNIEVSWKYQDKNFLFKEEIIY
ncbi:cytochrome Cbb3 oxidase maturation protein CcoH [Tenacibaculum holothuriorum]|uniref:Cytochrome Cbb3 oxidase maturation protein CcoH n=1 Tax=Tenacibaculum holothuriorum TaxID=1635173 RepID=A0A1Y2PE26_9FLAO|nr:FixH family protein [Tenacibaculum holothuriorum]OSY87989.1 cytochrome Cbb3 oxidase maturation protein CcoH [Tenacibaculum holothuriorum]